MKFLVVILCLIVSIECADVLVFGDSWGSFGKREFEDMFNKRGHTEITVDNVAVGGTTAEFWARTPQALTNAVTESGNVQWVWLSIGGNDGIYGLAAGKPIELIVEEAVNNTRIFLDPLFKDHPNVKVVQFGYDIVNFEMSIVCRTLGTTLFPYCNRDTGCMNREMYNLQYAVEILSGFYPRHTSVNLLGTMQKASGQVPLPTPNDDYFTPESLMNDCIHPNFNVDNCGFDALFDQLWEVYFRGEIEGQ